MLKKEVGHRHNLAALQTQKTSSKTYSSKADMDIGLLSFHGHRKIVPVPLMLTPGQPEGKPLLFPPLRGNPNLKALQVQTRRKRKWRRKEGTKSKLKCLMTLISGQPIRSQNFKMKCNFASIQNFHVKNNNNNKTDLFAPSSVAC